MLHNWEGQMQSNGSQHITEFITCRPTAQSERYNYIKLDSVRFIGHFGGDDLISSTELSH